MATNQNGNLLDDGGNVAIDFVWGNFPMQPNDVRLENGGDLLDIDADNHVIAYAGWNGYPQYTPNTEGEGAGYVLVPNVVGTNKTAAELRLEDLGLVVTVASAYTPAVNNVALTDNVATLTTAAAHGYSVGDSVVIAGLTTTALNGTFTLITGTTGSTLKFAKTAENIVSTADSGTAKVAAKANLVFSQSIAAGANEIEVGDAITITPYFAS